MINDHVRNMKMLGQQTVKSENQLVFRVHIASDAIQLSFTLTYQRLFTITHWLCYYALTHTI